MKRLLSKSKRLCSNCPLSENGERGAVAVEYAFGMLLAAFLMMGVEVMFRRMAIDVINFFKDLVTQFPSI